MPNRTPREHEPDSITSVTRIPQRDQVGDDKASESRTDTQTTAADGSGSELASMTHSDSNITERVVETETGVELHVRSKRGTGTRDEDKVSATVNVESVAVLASVREDMLKSVKKTMTELRSFDPDEEGDNEQ